MSEGQRGITGRPASTMLVHVGCAKVPLRERAMGQIPSPARRERVRVRVTGADKRAGYGKQPPTNALTTTSIFRCSKTRQFRNGLALGGMSEGQRGPLRGRGRAKRDRRGMSGGSAAPAQTNPNNQHPDSAKTPPHLVGAVRERPKHREGSEAHLRKKTDSPNKNHQSSHTPQTSTKTSTRQEHTPLSRWAGEGPGVRARGGAGPEGLPQPKNPNIQHKHILTILQHPSHPSSNHT